MLMKCAPWAHILTLAWRLAQLEIRNNHRSNWIPENTGGIQGLCGLQTRSILYLQIRRFCVDSVVQRARSIEKISGQVLLTTHRRLLKAIPLPVSPWCRLKTNNPFIIRKIFLWVCMHINATCVKVLPQARRGCQYLGAGVTGCAQLSNMGPRARLRFSWRATNALRNGTFSLASSEEYWQQNPTKPG